MQIKGAGSYVRVLVSRREVEDFKRRWPYSGLDGHALTFTFEQRTADLVDTSARPAEDGSALVALASDAQRYATRRGALAYSL